MNNFIKNFLSGISAIKQKSGTYKKIHTVNELLDLPNQTFPNYRKVHNVDLSELDLSCFANIFSGELPKMYMTTEEKKELNIVTDWTENVIWPTPDKMPKGINPIKILEEAKQTPEIKQLQEIGATGRGINIAIIDQRLNLEHPEYASNIKSYRVFGPWDKKGTDYHGSLVAGISVGHTTGVAPDANLYYFAAPTLEVLQDGKMVLSRKYAIEAIKEIIKFNQTHSDSDKIRFLSCSWGTKSDLHTEECEKLFDICKQNGIKIIGASYEATEAEHFDKRYANKTGTIGIPTDGKTNPFWRGGYAYTRSGGASSTFPYLTGVFACACQENQIFFTRPDWQDELTQIMNETAIDAEYGGKIINPIGIRERVSEIAREMERNLIQQQKSTQYE